MRIYLKPENLIGEYRDGGKEKHTPCRGKGVLECTDCKAGLSTCQACDGGKVPLCPACRGEESLPCTACTDQPFRPFEVTAQLWLAHGSKEKALSCLQTGLEKAHAYFRDRKKTLTRDREFAEWVLYRFENENRMRELMGLKTSSPKQVEKRVSKVIEERMDALLDRERAVLKRFEMAIAEASPKKDERGTRIPDAPPIVSGARRR